MTTQTSSIISLIRPLSGDNNPEVRQNSDSDIAAFINVMSASAPFDVTVKSRFEITEDLTQAQIAWIACQCSILIIEGQPQEFSYKTPVLSVKRKRMSNSSRLSGLWLMVERLQDPAISWDDEINKILDDCDRYMGALMGNSDG